MRVRNRAGRFHPAWLFPAIPLLFLFYLPVGFILSRGFSDGSGNFTLTHLAFILGDAYYGRIFAFTLLQAGVSTLFSVLLALPLSFIMARFDFRGKAFIRALSLVPFVLPSILVALGFVIAFGNNGFLNRLLMSVFNRNEPPLPILYSFKAIILAHGFYNFPVAFRIISSSWETIPRSNYDAAELLGGRGFTLFRTVTLPYILPALLSSAVLIFLYCFGSFAIILVLGGGPRFTTIEVEMYNLMRVNLDLGKAGALGLLSTLFSLLLLYLHMIARERSTREEKREILPARCLSGEGAIMKLFSAFYLILMAAIVILPLVAVLFRSFTSARDQTEFSIAAYRSLFTGGKTANTIGTALRNSLLYALLTVCVALPLGTAVSYVSVRSRFGKGFETLAMLPIAVSSMVVALGYALIRSRLNPQGWTGSALSVILAHSVMAYPFVARTLTAGLGSLRSSYREAAASLGASPFRAFISVELPLLSRAIASASAFAFALSIGEFNAAVLLSEPSQPTLPVAIYRLVSAYNFSGACVLGSLLILLCIAAFIILDRLKESEAIL